MSGEWLRDISQLGLVQMRACLAAEVVLATNRSVPIFQGSKMAGGWTHKVLTGLVEV